MTPGEVQRLYFIIHTFLSYRLDELIPKMHITLPLQLWQYSLFWMPNQHKDKLLGEQLQLALQELGPVWIKFRQMLSTHHDLFPPHIANQLALLQDKVAPFDGKLAKQQIEAAMGSLPVEAWFDNFEIKPLASASITQVHTTQLKSNGKEVVIKVIHPDILPVIKADLKLIYHLAHWVPRLLPDGHHLRPTKVVHEYKKTLIDELNLLQESANAIQLQRNFEDSPMLYIPEVYPDYCSEGMMVMEHIYSIPVSDVAALEKNSTNMKLLAEHSMQVFFTQVFHDSFFHANMHPGNIFISYEHPENPKYISIDCRIVGSLNKEDKHYLAENFITFFNHDYHKVAELHINSGWVPPDTNIEEFKFAIHTVCEPIFEKPLAKISFGHVLLNLFNTAHHFNMEVQPQLVLLQKTLLYVKGVGHQLYPQLNLWKTAKPFLESWIKDQVSIPALVRAFKEKAPFWVKKMPELPELVYNSLHQGKYLQHSVDKIAHELQSNHVHQGQSRYFLRIGTTLVLSGTFLLVSQPEWGLMPSWLMAGGLITWFVSWHKTH